MITIIPRGLNFTRKCFTWKELVSDENIQMSELLILNDSELNFFLNSSFYFAFVLLYTKNWG